MVAERRALLSLHLHFVAQYKFFVIIVYYYIHLRPVLNLLNRMHDLFCRAFDSLSRTQDLVGHEIVSIWKQPQSCSFDYILNYLVRTP